MSQNQNNNLIEKIKVAFSGKDLPIKWTSSNYNNYYGWLELDTPERLHEVCELLVSLKARLVTITAYCEDRSAEAKKQAIAYHFAIDSILFNVNVKIYDQETLEPLELPSIVSYFINADWHEREFMEMFNIKIVNHPNPRRLFLDDRIDAGVFKKLIPFSAMVHGTGSKTLWEQVMLEKMGYVPKEEEPVEEPKFTKVEESKIEAPKAGEKE